MAYGDKIQAAREALPREEFLELINRGLTNKDVAGVKGIDLPNVRKLKQEYGLIGITPNRGGRPRKELDDMENDKLNNQETCQRMTINQALKFQEKLQKEQTCTSNLLCGEELAPVVEELLKKHLDEVVGTLEQIKQVFESTEIAI